MCEQVMMYDHEIFKRMAPEEVELSVRRTMISRKPRDLTPLTLTVDGKPLVVKFAEGLHQVSLPAGGGIWMDGWVGLAGRQGLGARP